MIPEDFANKILTQLGEDRWRELINAIAINSSYSPPSVDINHVPTIHIELDSETKGILRSIASDLALLASSIHYDYNGNAMIMTGQ